ncbi:MAG: hypothetical protein RIS99_1306, partial [Bacteroidota bacterium]
MKKMIVWICLFISMAAGAQTFFDTHSQRELTYLLGVDQNKTSYGLFQVSTNKNRFNDTIFTKIVKLDSLFHVLDSAVLPVYSVIGPINQFSKPTFMGKKEGKYLVFVTNFINRADSIGGGIDSSKSKRYVFEIDSNLNITEKVRLPLNFQFYSFQSDQQFFQDSSYFYSYSSGINLLSTNPLLCDEMLLVKMNQNLD